MDESRLLEQGGTARFSRIAEGGPSLCLGLYRPTVDIPAIVKLFEERISIQTGRTPGPIRNGGYVRILWPISRRAAQSSRAHKLRVFVLRICPAEIEFAGELKRNGWTGFNVANGTGFKQFAFFSLLRVSSPNAFAVSNRESPPWTVDMPSRRGKSIHRIHSVRPVFLIRLACCENSKDS